MAINSTLVADTIQPLYSKKLLEHAIQLTCLADYAEQGDVAAGAGAQSITFFRPPSASLTATGAPAALTEGTAPTARRDISYTPITVSLSQRGATAEVTDIASTVGLMRFLDTAITTMSEEYALDCDSIIRGQLAHASTGLTKRYAQGLANFAALAAAAATAGCIVPRDLLDAMTALKIQRAPTFGGKYVAVLPPQLTRDILNSDLWREVVRQNNADKVFKGEIGEFFGCKIIESTNPMQEDETEGTYASTFSSAGTNTTGFIYTGMVLGKGAYGVASIKKLGASSLYKPQVIINDKPDKSDPLNQKIIAGWKAYWGSAVLNAAFGVALRGKSQFA